MVNKSKTYVVLSLLVVGFIFLGTGCAEKNGGDSSSEIISSEGGSVQTVTAIEVKSISVKGSDTILPLAQAEAEEFMIESEGRSIAVAGGAKAKGVNPVETTIAYDGITVIVNPSNPVSNLTFDQLRGIYNGTVSNWKDVGGEDKQISVTSRDSSSGTYTDFQKYVMVGDNCRSDACIQPVTEEVVTEVSQNANAIGYIGFAYLDNTVKALNLDAGNGSVAPASESILDGTYPLSRSLKQDRTL